MRHASSNLPVRLGILAAFAVAACGNSGSDGNGSPSSSTASPAMSNFVVTLPSSSAAPATSAAPTTSAAALPNDDPSAAPAVSATAPAASASAAAAKQPIDAGAPKDAGAKPAAKDAGATASAADAGSSSDAGAALALAPAGPGDEIARKVDTIYVGKKTFSARFKQQYTQKISGAPKNSSGTVVVEKPNKISFRYDAPNKNRIVSDGVTLKIYVAEDSQMNEIPVQKTQYPGALAFLMGNGISPSFAFVINDKAAFEGGPVLLGKPLQPNGSYEYVMFYVDKELLAKSDPGVIRRVLIVDAQGNKNRFDFENATQPNAIDPAEFTFTPPAGTNIIH